MQIAIQSTKAYLPISMKNITSTIESTTSSDTSSDVLFLKATLYGTWAGSKSKGPKKRHIVSGNSVLGRLMMRLVSFPRR